ncbi:MAG: ABC transporter substrate-binding protein [bacterium]|nr:ABC transporter substrate-binding protein [bacterium]
MRFLKLLFSSFTRTERVVAVIAAIIACVSFAGLALLFLQKATTTAPARGGEYAEGFAGQPAYVNPLLAQSTVDRSLVRLLFSNLTDLSDKIEFSNYGRTVNVRLKESAAWSDGAKLTSDDVIFTVQKIQDPETGSPLFASWQGVTVGRVSELELKFNLANSYAFFADNLKELYIIPKHLFADVPSVNWRLSEYNLKPIGSGPYAFDRYEKRSDGFIESYRAIPNTHYFGVRPFIDRMVFAFFPKEEDVIKAFNAGVVDGFAEQSPGEPSTIERPYQESGFSLPSYYAVFFNQSQNLPLQDPAVREALLRSTNREEALKRAVDGKGTAVRGPIPETIPDLSLDIYPEEFDIDAANTKLEINGWKLSDEGVRVKMIKNASLTLAFDLTVPDVPFLVRTAQALVEMWAKIGARVNVITVAPQDVVNTVIKNRAYNALLFGNVLSPSGDLFSFWHSSERFYPGLNLALYSNKKVDAAIESVRQDQDADARREQFTSLANTILNDMPAIFLYSPANRYITSKDVYGANPGFISEPADRFLQAGNWYVKTARVLKDK